MNLLRLLMSVLVAGICFSCTGKKAIDFKSQVADFADVECGAVRLRVRRFALADSIRFTEDSILHPTNGADTVKLRAKLNRLLSHKEDLLLLSRGMADKIKGRMDSMMQFTIITKEDRAQFNKELNDELMRRGCLQ